MSTSFCGSAALTLLRVITRGIFSLRGSPRIKILSTELGFISNQANQIRSSEHRRFHWELRCLRSQITTNRICLREGINGGGGDSKPESCPHSTEKVLIVSWTLSGMSHVGAASIGKGQKGLHKRGIHDQGDFWKFPLETTV